MTSGSWLYMATVWAIIIGAMVFCFRRMFRKR